jgi:hypothetical protein
MIDSSRHLVRDDCQADLPSQWLTGPHVRPVLAKPKDCNGSIAAPDGCFLSLSRDVRECDSIERRLHQNFAQVWIGPVVDHAATPRGI